MQDIYCSPGFSRVRHRGGFSAIIPDTSFIVWIWWNIKHEMAHFVRVRQHYLVSRAHSSTAQACTILVTGIPPKYLSESALTRLFGHLPGGVRKVWVNRDLGDMPKLYKRRLKVCKKLESAETSLLNKAVQRNNKKQKTAKAGNEEDGIASSHDPEVARNALVEELVPKKERPSHRLPCFTWLPFSIPFVGKKVDTIDWARGRIHELNVELEQRRSILARDIAQTTAEEAQVTNRAHRMGAGKLNFTVPAVPVSIPLVKGRPSVEFSDQTYPPANGAFILFNKQIAAHMAAQTLTHHEPYRMSGSLKYIEVSPEDVIWNNLVMNPYERRVRLALSWAATVGLIILWAIPGSLHLDLSRRRFNVCSSGVHWGHYEHPLVMYDISLARLGLRPPGRGCQLHPGFSPVRITRLALHASANSLADIGTPGRYPSEDRCGAKFDGSVLLVSSNRT